MANYEEKYKNALSQAKQAINNIPDESLAKWLQSIFPELQESDDEKMRAWLIEYFDKVNDEISKDDRKKIIAWLGKQEQKPEELPNGEDYGIDSLYHAARILEKTLGEVEGYQSDDGILEHKCAIEAVKRLYEQKTIDIDKACEWLKTNAGKYAFVDTDRIGNVADIDLTLVQDFKEYMK